MPSDNPRSAAPDRWSHLSAVMSAVNPLLLLVVGYVLNAGINDANSKIAEQKVAIDQQRVAIEQQKSAIDQLKTSAETASVTTRTQVDKAKVISDFLNDLTGSNELRQRVAMQAIQIVLPPDEAIGILEAVKRSSPSGGKLAMEAATLVDKGLSYLVEDMFSQEQRKRAAALRALKISGASDELLIRDLLVRAIQDVKGRAEIKFPDPVQDDLDYQRRASIYNTAEFLASAKVSDPKLKQMINDFANAAQANSKDTRRVAEAIRIRFK